MQGYFTVLEFSEPLTILLHSQFRAVTGSKENKIKEISGSFGFDIRTVVAGKW